MRWLSFIAAGIVTVISTSATLIALEPREVFDAVAPSTALIQDVDSHGSGIVISDQGLILTNYHVAVGNVELKVKASIRFGDKIVLTEIRDVKLLKVHPDCDLALLQAKPPANGVFIPAKFLPPSIPVAIGSKCFAIGNPGGTNGEPLELTITQGLVSSASRNLDGKDYLQFSAAINPGNSGGPVCDELARVIGVSTAKMMEVEGIGFAIPSRTLDLREFIDLKQKKIDASRAQEASTAAHRYYMLSNLASGREKLDLLSASLECDRAALEANPGMIDAYTLPCFIYEHIGKIDIAKKYASAALKRDPENAFATHLLCKFAMKESPKDTQVRKQCLDMLFKVVAHANNGFQGYQCADDVAMTMLDAANYAAAAYMLQWAEHLTDGLNKDSIIVDRKPAWNTIAANLPPAEFEAIRSVKDGFTREKFDSFALGRPSFASIKSAPPETSSVKTSDGNKGALEQIAKSAAAQFAPKRIAANPEGLAVPLPDTPAIAVLTNYGWEVVLSFPALEKLGVVNLASGKMDGFIDFPEKDALFASGGSVLAVYLPSKETFQIYDLQTLKLSAEKKIQSSDRIRFLGMGLLNPSSIFVLKDGSPNPANPYAAAIVHLPDFEWKDLQVARSSVVTSNATPPVSGKAPLGGMDESGSVCAVTQAGVTPTTLLSYAIALNGTADLRILISEPGFANPGVPTLSPAGDYAAASWKITSLRGAKEIYSLQEQSNRTFTSVIAFIAGYPGVVEHFLHPMRRNDSGGFHVRSFPSLAPLSDIEVSEATAQSLPTHAEQDIPLMLASGYADRIIYLKPDQKKMLLFDLGMKDLPAASSVASAESAMPPTPGQLFEKKLFLPAGTAVTIQSGPSGLTYDQTKTSLVWNVPADTKKAQTIQVIMLVTKPGAKKEYLIEKIQIP